MTEPGHESAPRNDLLELTWDHLQRIHGRVAAAEAALLRRYGLSAPKYHLLRILREAEGQALPCTQIAERMVHRVPDITRLADRLVELGFVTRRKAAHDGRVVIVSLDPRAIPMLDAIALPLRQVMVEQFRALAPSGLSRLQSELEALLGRESERPAGTAAAT